MKPPKPCIVPGCGVPLYGEGARCPTHRQPDRHKNRASFWERYGPEYRANRAKLLKRARVCYWCGKPPTATDPLTADHLVAVVDGGSHSLRNLVAAHRSCNSRRGGQLNAR